jgi:hypothetical protein
MRVLKPTETDAEGGAERRLVAEMLCLEHGARAVGPDLQPLPSPHEPWPVVKLRPITAKGVPYAVHYRPTVGVVFYTLAPGSHVADLVGRLSAQLERAGDAHLRAYRAVAATPATVLRHKGRIAGGHVIVGPRKCYKKPVAEKSVLPARLLQWTHPDDDEPPPHYSIRAAFTWVFMPVTAALAIGEGGFDSMPAVNATLSAVFYDEARICNIPDGGEVSPLTIGNFEGVGLPPFLLPPAGGVPTRSPLRARGGALLGARSGALLGARGGALLVDGAGRLTYIGRLLNLHLKTGRGVWPPGRNVLQLPAEAWAPETILLPAGGGFANAKSRGFQCVSCMAPLGGEVVVIRAPRAPATGQHREWFYYPVGSNAPLIGGALAGGGLLLCAFCWNALESPACLSVHMGARVTHTVLPFSQAEAAAACPGYEPLAPLLAGTALPLAGAEGAFVVKTPDGGPGGGASVILACEKLGRYPALTHPAVAAAKLGVVSGVALAEVRAGL